MLVYVKKVILSCKFLCALKKEKKLKRKGKKAKKKKNLVFY